MIDSFQFTTDIVRGIQTRFLRKTNEIALLLEFQDSLKNWLEAEAFLACSVLNLPYSFCEISLQPTYASEGISDSLPSDIGSLRVGGPEDGANHCWAFIEIAFQNCLNADEDQSTILAAVTRLKSLGWKKSAAILYVVSRSAVGTVAKVTCDQPTIIPAEQIPLADGSILRFEAFDIKRDTANILCVENCKATIEH